MAEEEKQKKNQGTSEIPVDIDQEIVYYYSREKRLERASPQVRALNDYKNKQKENGPSGFLSRPNIMPLISIVMIFIMFTIISRLSREDTSVLLGGNRIDVKIYKEEGLLILELLKKFPIEGEFYTGDVDIIVSPVLKKGEEPSKALKEFHHRVSFNAVDSENYVVSLPFEENDFYVILINPNEQKSLRIRAKTKTPKRSVSN